MYRQTDYEQLTLELPFGVNLNSESRWVKLVDMFPWEKIEYEYMRNFCGQEGQIAKPARLAFGALYIQTAEGFTDEQTRRHIQENPYLQYFCGFEVYTTQSPFDASMMTYFRKRISAGMIQNITADVFAVEAQRSMDNSEENDAEETSTDAPEEICDNKGTLILDATCCPADIHYPTDIGLLNQSRELSEAIIDELYQTIQDRYAYKPRTYRQKARKKYLASTKKRIHTKQEIRRVIRGQLQYVARNFRTINELLQRGAELTAFDLGLYRRLLVTKEIYRQQKAMYDSKTHQTEGRIVSIAQPHIRPIVRGKEHAPVEFGAKVAIGLVGGYAFITSMDWDNFSEAKALPEAAEAYRAMFGVYPKTIIGDRAYPTRDNRLWCQQRNIRLSGPRLGRKSAEEKTYESKRIYQDSCVRNAVEGSFGTGKRRFGLERIMTRLPDTSKTSIAMGFFAANMERKLRLLFAPNSDWALDYDPDLLCLLIFSRNSNLEVIQ